MTTIPTTPPWPEYGGYVRRFGLTFNPEKSWREYASHPAGFVEDGVHGKLFNACVEAAFGYPGGDPDPYTVALAVWHEAGLLGVGDPGPPAFRESHKRYVEAQQLLKMSAQHGTIAIKREIVAQQPRISLRELLGMLAGFRFGFDEDRDLLIAWFAERGIKIDA